MFPHKILRNKADFAKYGKLYNLIGMTAYSSHLDPGHKLFTQGVIKGVAIINNQVAGLEVETKDETYLAHSSYFFVHGFDQIVQNSYIYSEMGIKAHEALEPWLIKPNTFYGPEWDGIEKIYMDIAKIAENVIIETPTGKTPGLYFYKLSPDQIGETWRFVLPPAPFSSNDPTLVSTCINFHSIVHSNQWTITVTITEERNVKLIQKAFADGQGSGNRDPWVRSMKWAIITSHLLEGDNKSASFAEARANMKKRLFAINRVHRIKHKWQPAILDAYKKVIAPRPLCFKKNPKFPYITIMINDWWLKAGTVGMYMQPLSNYNDTCGPKDQLPAAAWYKETDFKYGILGISPKAFYKKTKNKLSYVEYIIIHELIHAILDERCSKERHGADFQRIADYLGMPKKFQN